MSLLAALRSTDGPLLRAPAPPEAGGAAGPQAPRGRATEPVLPRHVLVSLAAIIAEVSSVRQRLLDGPADLDPQLPASLESVLGRLDGLVDSIYGRGPIG